MQRDRQASRRTLNESSLHSSNSLVRRSARAWFLLPRRCAEANRNGWRQAQHPDRPHRRVRRPLPSLMRLHHTQPGVGMWLVRAPSSAIQPPSRTRLLPLLLALRWVREPREGFGVGVRVGRRPVPCHTAAVVSRASSESIRADFARKAEVAQPSCTSKSPLNCSEQELKEVSEGFGPRAAHATAPAVFAPAAPPPTPQPLAAIPAAPCRYCCSPRNPCANEFGCQER